MTSSPPNSASSEAVSTDAATVPPLSTRTASSGCSAKISSNIDFVVWSSIAHHCPTRCTAA